MPNAAQLSSVSVFQSAKPAAQGAENGEENAYSGMIAFVGMN